MEPFEINYTNVVASSTLSNATRNLARTRMENPYMTVGDYFITISDDDLHELLQLANRDDNDAYPELLLLSEMLSRGEGVITENEEELTENIGFVRMLIAAVALQRKGMVKVNYEKISFSRDMMGCVIIEAIDD